MLYFYDDHCLVTYDGENWAIRRVHRATDATLLMVWRLQRTPVPVVEHCAIDVTHVDWEHYCARCSALLTGGTTFH